MDVKKARTQNKAAKHKSVKLKNAVIVPSLNNNSTSATTNVASIDNKIYSKHAGKAVNNYLCVNFSRNGIQKLD